MKFFFVLVFTILVTSISFFSGYSLLETADKKYSDSQVLSLKSGVDQYPITQSPSPIPTTTPSSKPTPSPFPIPTPTNVPKPTNTPTQKPVPQPNVSAEMIHGYLERFAGQYAVDVNVIRHLAICESGFNPNAVNGKYAGLFQFDTTTWKNNRKLMGEDQNPDLRFNAEESIQTASYLVSIGKRYLWPNCYP